MKKILVTSGPVYAHLDDNKILSNLARGKWANHLCEFLHDRGHVTSQLHNTEYWEYKRRCIEEAKWADAAVMTAAVINYIPESPFQGKMPTDLDTVNVQLIRAPYVIDEMRRVNPKLKLIGCKLTSREPIESTIEKAQHLIRRSRAHAIVANDKKNLRLKLLCFPDGAVIPFDNDFSGLYEELERLILDEHFHTVENRMAPARSHELAIMEMILDRYRGRFSRPFAGQSVAFGSVAVRAHGRILVTPRTKSSGITTDSCILARVERADRKVITDCGKATMNAPLLWAMLKHHGAAAAVLHLHEELPNVPTLNYAPPGTVRDSIREDLPEAFNIQGHGFVACLNRYGDFIHA